MLQQQQLNQQLQQQSGAVVSRGIVLLAVSRKRGYGLIVINSLRNRILKHSIRNKSTLSRIRTVVFTAVRRTYVRGVLSLGRMEKEQS